MIEEAKELDIKDKLLKLVKKIFNPARSTSEDLKVLNHLLIIKRKTLLLYKLTDTNLNKMQNINQFDDSCKTQLILKLNN